MKKVLVIAGEASGDLHASNLVRATASRDPSIAFFGVGSSRMRDAGVRMLADASEISVVGITEVATHAGAIFRVYGKLRKFLRDERPDLLVLIDFPDFNILVGKAARRLGIPIVYYISPQVWAWRRGRIRTIAGLVRTMMVVFPFEERLYRDAGVDVRFVGHPLTDVVRSSFTVEDARKRFGLDPGRRTVAVLPGSRRSEVAGLLPAMLDAAGSLHARFSDLQFILPVAPTLPEEHIRTLCAQAKAPVTVTSGSVYDVLRASDAAIVASGTATLETALMNVPMVIVYRVSRLTALLVRMLATYDHVGLPNIVAGRRIVPELLQEAVTGANIDAALVPLLEDRQARDAALRGLAEVRRKLGEEGASARAAAVVLEQLGIQGGTV